MKYKKFVILRLYEIALLTSIIEILLLLIELKKKDTVVGKMSS